MIFKSKEVHRRAPTVLKTVMTHYKDFRTDFSQEDYCLKVGSSISTSSKEYFGTLTQYIIQKSRQKCRLRVDQTILDGRCSRFLYMHNICAYAFRCFR